MTNLVIAEHDNSAIRPGTLNTVAAAQAIGGEVHVLVAGKDCGGAAEAAARSGGFAKVLVADGPEYEHAIAENFAPLIVKLAEGYSHLLAPAGTFGKNIMPRVAALMDLQQISDIIGVQSEDTFERPIYAGNAIATVQSTDPKKIVTVRSEEHTY